MKSLVIAVLITCVLFMVTGCVFNEERTFRESKVDTLPIAELSSEDIGRLLDALEIMERDGTISLQSTQPHPGAIQLLEVRSYNWVGDDDARLSFSVNIFETEQGAIDYTPSESEYRTSQQNSIRVTDNGRRPFSFILYDNGTEARLRDSGVETDEYKFIIYWSISSAIRLENYRISITEHRYSDNFDDPTTSKLIKQLVDTIKNTGETP